MNPFEEDAADFLFAARERGSQAVGNMPLAAGLNHFTLYAGLIGSALELAKLIQTEERDLTVIHHHYEISVAQISAAFEEVEKAMRADFQRDETLKEKTFEAINQLIAAGQYEIAGEFHKRLIDGFKRTSLDTLLDYRNQMAGQSGSKLAMRSC